MKSIISIFLLLTSCTSTTVSIPNINSPPWTLHRTSILQKMDIQLIQISTNGTVTIQGYKSDGGQEIASQVTEAAVRAAIKSVVP